jgi:hypothetical protein
MTYADIKWKDDYETINLRKLHNENFILWTSACLCLDDSIMVG